MNLLRKGARNWRLAWRFLQALFKHGYLPLNLDFHITKRCNLSCKHCYAKLDSLKENQDFTLDQIKHVVDQAYAMGVRWIRLLGGEPLVRKDVGEVIRYIKSKNIFCELNTNATLIPHRLKEIAPVDAICISLDGPRDANDVVRGEGSFDRIIAGIEAAVGAGHTPRLHAVVSRHNLRSIEAMNAIATKYHLRFNYNHCALEEYPDSAFNLTKEESRDFCNRIMEAKRQGFRISNSENCVQLMSQWPFDFNVVSYDYIKAHPELKQKLPECQMCYKAVYLDSDGKVYACPRRWKHGISIKDGGLEKAWKYALESRPCYVCKEMAIIERGLIFGGNFPAIVSAFFGFA